MAAMRRYYENTRLDLDEMSVDMLLHLRAFENTGVVDDMFGNWHRSAISLNIARNLHDCAEAGLTKSAIKEIKEPAHRVRHQISIQKTISKSLHERKYGSAKALQFLRKRLQRWKLVTPLGIAVRRASRNISTINKRCPARVAAAYLRTLLNGWCTERRMRTLNPGTASKRGCVFGCGGGDDSIEHYAHCSMISQTLETYSSHGLALDNFLLIGANQSSQAILLQARKLYAIYVAHGPFDMMAAIPQACPLKDCCAAPTPEPGSSEAATTNGSS